MTRRHALTATKLTRRMRGSRLALAFLWLGAGAAGAAEVNLYTTREPGLIRPLLDAYTARSGVTVNTVFVEKGLAERVAAEGERAKARN